MDTASLSQRLQQEALQASHSILLTGATGFLGGHYLLHRIAGPGRVHALVRGQTREQARARLYEHLAHCAAAYGRPLPKAELDARLVVHLGDITLPLCGLDEDDLAQLHDSGVSQFWHCAASLKFEDRHRSEILSHNIEGTANMLALFARFLRGTDGQQAGAAEFVHISTAYSAGKAQGQIAEQRHHPEREFNNVYEESKNLAENQVVDYCTRHRLSYRILRPTIVMGPLISHHSGTTRFGVYGFTREVYRLRETLSKLKHPLQLLGHARATANLTPVDACVLDMLQLARKGFGQQRFFHLSNPDGVPMPDLIAEIDRITGANRLDFVEQRHGDGGPLQELFDERTRFYAGYYNAEKHFQRTLPPQPQVHWEDLQRYLGSFLDELRQEQDGGVGYRQQQVRVRDGSELRVFCCGNPTAPALVLANAYGMPAEFYWPLAQRLQAHFHVVTWECRWVPDARHPFDPDNCSSSVHAGDLLDILQALGLERAGVVGWSSGAQVALAAMAAAPEHLHGAVLLNPGVSIRPSATVRTTVFENGIRTLFAKISGNYRMAEKYCELIYGATATEAGDSQLLSGILTSTDPYLLYMTSQPFRTAQSLYRYANMMHTLFAERADAWTAEVVQPVTVLVGGKDVVTHPDVGQALVDGLANGQLVMDAEADHFAHYYDERIATLIVHQLCTEPSLAALP